MSKYELPQFFGSSTAGARGAAAVPMPTRRKFTPGRLQEAGDKSETEALNSIKREFPELAPNWPEVSCR